jgi:hypothetical protein
VATAVIQGLLRLSPVWTLFLLPAYLAAGYLTAIGSTVLVNRSWEKAAPLLHPVRLARYAREHDRYTCRQAGVAFGEELVWRALPTYLLLEVLELPAATLLPVSMVFALLHLYRHEIYAWELVELFAFSSLLALSYLAWRDLALVVALHLVRNVSGGFLLWVRHGCPPPRRPAHRARRPPSNDGRLSRREE